MATTDTRPANLPADRAKELAEVERLAVLLDTAIRIPVVNYRMGLDGLLGLIPGIGDAATLVPAGYILYRAKTMGVPNDVFLKMLVNTGADAVLGSVPLIGDLFDIAFKSNKRNVQLLREHLERAHMRDVTPAR
jgi:Domain of unknown function (DUF4112)